MDEQLRQRLLRRPKNANKYDFGHVLILGGSPGMVGAPLLAGKAALRVGAGLVTIASDKDTTSKLEKRVEEIMTLSLPEQTERALAMLLDFIQKRKVTSIIIGPGLSLHMGQTIRQLVTETPLPMIIDAGGLAAFRQHLPSLQKLGERNSRIVITPHAGEYSSLTGSSTNLEKDAKQFAVHNHLTVVLKGDHTLIAYADGTSYKNTTGNPGLATTGTGDALSGIIAGLLAQGIDVVKAAQAGVYLHGKAGDLAAKSKTESGMIASDVIEYIPEALKS
jgi:ADP-dependent NAD(P)H-hydrate dehydratase / NAD(P)H-hydrate epimerase